MTDTDEILRKIEDTLPLDLLARLHIHRLMHPNRPLPARLQREIAPYLRSVK